MFSEMLGRLKEKMLCIYNEARNTAGLCADSALRRGGAAARNVEAGSKSLAAKLVVVVKTCVGRVLLLFFIVFMFIAAVAAGAAKKLRLAAASTAGFCVRGLRLVIGAVRGFVFGIGNWFKNRILRMRHCIEAVRSSWRGNQHFTFWLIPADGQHVARKHLRKKHIRIAFTCIGIFLVGVFTTIGVLAHFAVLREGQREELAAYERTKEANERAIQELRKMAEENQKELAYLAKLEDEVREQMEKGGMKVPEKTDISAFGGKGGPYVSEVSEMNVVFEQERNIRSQAGAKKQDFEKLLKTIKDENYRREFTPSQWPTEGGVITSYFGGRSDPFGYGSDWHPGIDIGNYYGAPVYAAASGYVAMAGWMRGYGRYIEINHDYGYVTVYGHMSSIIVEAGEYVTKGQIIAYVGSSGYSTGPHLHFEIIRYGREINPLNLI